MIHVQTYHTFIMLTIVHTIEGCDIINFIWYRLHRNSLIVTTTTKACMMYFVI